MLINIIADILVLCYNKKTTYNVAFNNDTERIAQYEKENIV